MISGNTIHNENVSANMLRSKFYVCPVCGNVIHSMGEAVIQCHGVTLLPAEAEPTDEKHVTMIERIEDEYFVRIDHEMTKEHYISFVAALSSDGIHMIKLYPEGNAEVRIKRRGVRKLCFFCNRDGLFSSMWLKGLTIRKAVTMIPQNAGNWRKRRICCLVKMFKSESSKEKESGDLFFLFSFGI